MERQVRAAHRNRVVVVLQDMHVDLWDLLEDAKGRPHYFRYLQIMQLDDSNERAIAITAFEPSSYMDVEFIVTKRVSLQKLQEEPRSKLGDAIAITGVVRSVNGKTIHVGPVIVRHKDRLAPKRGKEMFYEIDPSGTFYSYTGGKRPVSLTYQDRDLLTNHPDLVARGITAGIMCYLNREEISPE